MTKYRYTIKGRNSWERQPERQKHARWEKPQGELGIVSGGGLLFVLFVIGTLALVAIGG